MNIGSIIIQRQLTDINIVERLSSFGGRILPPYYHYVTHRIWEFIWRDVVEDPRNVWTLSKCGDLCSHLHSEMSTTPTPMSDRSNRGLCSNTGFPSRALIRDPFSGNVSRNGSPAYAMRQPWNCYRPHYSDQVVNP